MSDSIAKAISEGKSTYNTLKKWYPEPEKANIHQGYYTRCNRDAWHRGFQQALRKDEERWKFLQRIEE